MRPGNCILLCMTVLGRHNINLFQISNFKQRVYYRARWDYKQANVEAN